MTGQPVVALLGAGRMGQAVLSGLLRAGWDVGSVVAIEAHQPTAQSVRDRLGVRVLADPAAAADAAVVVVAVKPHDVAAALDGVAGHLAADAVVVSLAAGVGTPLLAAHLPAGTAVVRVMPNTPALVGEGMAAVSAGSTASQADVEHAMKLMTALGKAITVPEAYQDAVTAISGSGPAYLFFVVEAMIDAGVLLGLPRDISSTLVSQTIYGSAKLLVESGQHPTVLREQVTSPGGTTAAALRQLEDHKVKAAFLTAIEAARDRSRALAG